MKKYCVCLVFFLLSVTSCNAQNNSSAVHSSGGHDSTSLGSISATSQNHSGNNGTTYTKEENYQDPTCTEAGHYDLVTYKQSNGVELSRTTIVIPALGHNLVHHEGSNPTCDMPGYAEYDTCTRCDYTTYQVIPAKNHSNTATKKENNIEPTCTKGGSYTLITYCSDCGEVLKREHFDVEALNHDYKAVDHIRATYEEDGYDVFECQRCHDQQQVKTEERLTHTYSNNYSYNESYHWHNCLDEGYDDQYISLESHTYNSWSTKSDNGSTKVLQASCTECGHTHERIKNKCSTCGGDGIKDIRIDCPDCSDGKTYRLCGLCSGSGRRVTGSRSCTGCGGSGKVVDGFGKYITCPFCRGSGSVNTTEECGLCGGEGRLYNGTCTKCSGSGTIASTENCTTCNKTGWITYFNLNYELNGGDSGPSNTKYAGTATISSTKPVKSGYKFVGWSILNDNNKVYKSGESYSGEDDVTFHAIWGKVCTICGGNSSTCTHCHGNGYEIPSAPEAKIINPDSVTLKAQKGYEYSKDGTTWQDYPFFNDLTCNTTYSFYMRKKATPYAPFGITSATLSIKTPKFSEDRKIVVRVESVTSNSVVVTAISGVEYSLNGTTWQESNTFTGLTQNHEYTIFFRYKETNTHYAGSFVGSIKATTNKLNAAKPSAPILESRTSTTITVRYYSGYEYSLDGTTWQESNIFTGLQPNTRYYIYQRTKENDDYYASMASDPIGVRTAEADN